MREMISQYGTILLAITGANLAVGMAFLTLHLCRPLLESFLQAMM